MPGAPGPPGPPGPAGAPGPPWPCGNESGFGSPSAGATVVLGSWLPPEISLVWASGAASGSDGLPPAPPSPTSLICGAYTVAGSGTERSSPDSALVSVPAHGVASAGTPEPPEASPPAAGHDVPPPGAEDAPGPPPGPGNVSGIAPPPPAPPCAGPAEPPGGTASLTEAAAAAAGRDPAPSDALSGVLSEVPSEVPSDGRDEPPPDAPPDDPPEAAPDAPPDVRSRRSGMPIRSAASWSHSGGVSRNDVWLRSTRAGGAGAGSGAASGRPYSSSYRRITSPTGSEGHRVASPLSRAMTSRWAPPSDRGPSARSSAHTTNPSSNSRTRTSRCW